MKIGFFSINHLRDWGGIQTLIDQLAVGMIAKGHEVIIIAQEGKVSSKVPVSPRDYPHELIALDLESAEGRTAAKEKIKASGMDICAASLGDDNFLYMPRLFSGSGIPYVIGEPGNPCVYIFERGQPYHNYGALYAADAFTVLMDVYPQFYPAALRPRAHAIGNPAPPPIEVDFAARRSRQTRTIISVGRFSEADKRFSLLIRAFAQLCGDFPDWRLKLVGDGPFWGFYHEMAKQLGIKERVDFTGSVADPNPHYLESDIFCLPSGIFEGFGLVFVEAAAAALPLVSFRTNMAASSMIEEGMGALAETTPDGDTPETLAAALRPLMELSPEGREKIGIKARDTLQARYGGDIIYDQWEKLLIDTMENTRKRGGTQLDKTLDKMKIIRDFLGDQWDELGPDSPVWTENLLEKAAAEIAGREDPIKAPTDSGADEETESVRLRCELARMQQNYRALEKKYAALLGQFGQKPGKRRR